MLLDKVVYLLTNKKLHCDTKIPWHITFTNEINSININSGIGSLLTTLFFGFMM